MENSSQTLQRRNADHEDSSCPISFVPPQLPIFDYGASVEFDGFSRQQYLLSDIL